MQSTRAYTRMPTDSHHAASRHHALTSTRTSAGARLHCKPHCSRMLTSLPGLTSRSRATPAQAHVAKANERARRQREQHRRGRASHRRGPSGCAAGGRARTRRALFQKKGRGGWGPTPRPAHRELARASERRLVRAYKRYFNNTVIRNNTDNGNNTKPRITTPNNVKASPYNVFGRALREALSGRESLKLVQKRRIPRTSSETRTRRLRARFSLHAAAQSIEEDRAEGVGRAEAGDSCRRCRGYRSTSRSGDGGGRRRAARGWDAVITRKNTSHPALNELLLFIT